MNRIQFLKNHFFAGLLVVIPLGVIVWLLGAVFQILKQVHQFLPENWKPDNFIDDPAIATLINGLFTFGLVVLILVGVSFLGWASKQFLGKKILEMLGGLIQRIPVIRSIYSALDQLLRTLAAGGGQQFNRVVYIEYPRKGVWAIAFVTGPVQTRALPEGLLNVYVPTTPNPTSGFHLIVQESEVRESHMKVEEAFKVLLSLGIAQPSEVPLKRG